MTSVDSIFAGSTDFIILDTQAAENISQLLEATGSALQKILLDAANAKTEAEFMEEVFVKMSFPDYFGKNWSAFYDSFTDVLGQAWENGTREFLLVFLHTEQLFSNASDDEFEALLETLKNAIDWPAFAAIALKLKVSFVFNDLSGSGRLQTLLEKAGYPVTLS